MKINAVTRVMAVIGDPIAHSLSPLMQNWFIEQTGVNAVYTAFHVTPDQIENCVNGMRALGISGFNVTVPHKAAVVGFADSLSPEVEQLGVANTLHNQDGHVTAHVTDPVGFIESLGRERERFEGASVLLFGAGGASTSVAYALGKLKIKALYITDPATSRANSLANMCRQKFNLTKVTIIESPEPNINDIINSCDVLINTSPLGMHPLEDKSVITDFTPISSRHFIYDLVYNPGMTRLMQLGKEQGARVQNGLGMLIHQGLASFRIFTGEPFYLTPAQEQDLQTIMNKALGV